MVYAADEVKLLAISPIARNVSATAAEITSLALQAPRNGYDSTQFVLQTVAATTGLSAETTDLAGKNGEIIAASNLQVRYADHAVNFYALRDKPITGRTLQYIWLTVKVPKDTPAGDYTGILTLKGLDKSITLPIKLTVFELQIAAPHDWKAWVNVLQSPESVAGYYQVPLWSDEHFKYMEKSLQMMGGLGNDVLGVNIIGKTVFGDDPIIVFRKEAGVYTPNFSYLDRYLELYDKYAGEPKFLSLQVWHYNDGARGATGNPGTLTLYEEVGGKRVAFSSDDEVLWKKIFDGVQDSVKKRKWNTTRILLGTAGDLWPAESIVEFYKRVAPFAQWRILTHGVGCRKWGITDDGRRQPTGMIAGYLEIARRLPNGRISMPEEHPVTCNSRDDVGSEPSTYRGFPITMVNTYNFDGICWKGIDYWPFPNGIGGKRNALNTYIGFGNMVGATPRAITLPGKDGALSTVQYEMLRQGLQECEALYILRDGLKKKFSAPTTLCDVHELILPKAIAGKDKNYSGLNLLIYEHDGHFGVLPSAPDYNTGHRSGTITKIDADTYAVSLEIDDDNWVTGGKGKFVIKLVRIGNTYSGTFTGAFNGIPSAGGLRGTFSAKAYKLVMQEERPKNELEIRAENTIAAYLSAINTNGDLAIAVANLYNLAAEVNK
ncbi:MAG: glycoside hydrolase domain-containing protein [bacterium]